VHVELPSTHGVACTEGLEDALALSAEQRLDLAAELLASVDDATSDTWEAAWRAELDDCMREVESGAVRPVRGGA
jgi:hypothetical protein